MQLKNKTKIKTKGQVHTPKNIVNTILDLSHYNNETILNKHVMDNSCGDGAFLCEIVRRYCMTAKQAGFSLLEIKEQLAIYIHGIEIDEEEHSKCLKNLDAIAAQFGIHEAVKWDIICGDTLKIDKYNGKMDYVLGNPPYVRVHNLNESFDTAKKYAFAQDGMTDLYIVFYEIGIKMLNEDGVLGYITPSSFFNSLAGSYMRNFLVQNNLIERIVDLKHYQAFNATTYTAITILNKRHCSKYMEYYQFDERNLIPYYVETLNAEDYYIANNFYFSTKQNLTMLRRIFQNLGKCDIEVKNGYATLCDDVFIGNFNFDSRFTIPAIKASRGELKIIIYPYDRAGRLLSEEELFAESQLREYLLKNKQKLIARSSDKEKQKWYAYGRSQAINDTYKDKISINTLVRTVEDLKLIFAPAGTGVYSGLYLVDKELDLEKIKKILMDDEFITYISLLGKYKSGGYYTFSSKDLKAYLNYKVEAFKEL